MLVPDRGPFGSGLTLFKEGVHVQVEQSLGCYQRQPSSGKRR